MTPETVTLDQALALLSLPRVVGADPADGAEITAQNGRYGPYIKKGTDSRSLATEEQLLTITLDEALAVLAQPKRGRGAGRGQAAAQGARRRPRERQADGGQGRAVRAVRHRRRDQRHPVGPRRRHPGERHPGAGRLAPPDPPRGGPAEEAGRREGGRSRSADDGEEGVPRSGQRTHGQDGVP